jgi:glycosyltransferase involved in cell wall biosynthesis
MDKDIKPNKLNIVMLGHKRVPSREGGIEVVVEELSVRIAKRGYRITCFNRRGNHVSGKEYNTKRLDNYEGIILKKIMTLDKKGLAAMTSSILGTIKATFMSYNVLHFHGIGNCIMIWLPKLFNKKCIVSVHGLDHKSPKWSDSAKRYILLSERFGVKFADEIIVLSKSVQKYYWEKYNRKTVLLPNGVNRPTIKEADIINKVYDLNYGSYILYLGRIVPGKGIDYLIDAFKELNTDKKLVIAGGSSDTEEYVQHLKDIVKVEKRIIFTGFVEGQLLAELYSNAFVYVLPSDLEGMPLSLMEAMSYGNCCLVSNIPECKAVIGEKGIVFQQGSTNDLKEKLQELCDSPERVKEYKKEVASYICSKYNWDDIVEETLKLYMKR